jgi:hypothetical protein
MDTAILDKVRALLSKAERTDNEHEAEAFSRKAEELLVKYSIDRALLESRGQEVKQTPIRKDIVIEAPYITPKATLLNVISKAHDVQAVQLRTAGSATGTVALVGFPSDIELVEVLFASLLLQAVNAVPKDSQFSYGRSRTRSFRSSFLTGFAAKVGQRLQGIRQQAERAAEGPGTALVLRDRKQDVQTATKALFPRAKSVTRSVGNSSGFAYGTRAGATANIGQTGLGGSRRALV